MSDDLCTKSGGAQTDVRVVEVGGASLKHKDCLVSVLRETVSHDEACGLQI